MLLSKGSAMSARSTTFRRAVMAGAVVTGAGLTSAGIAAAASGSSGAGSANRSAASTSNLAASTSPTTAPAGGPPPGGPPAGGQPDPAAMTHGPNETLLTGADLQKADAAAEAAVPGATIVRAETDSSGASPYEVHMKKSDGTYVTVQLDSNFNAIKTITGFGPGPAGSQPPNGPIPPANGTGTSTAA